MNNTAIEARDLVLTYDEIPVLKKLSVTFEKGRLYAVVGPNGCGKTTMLRTLCRLLSPSSGSILLDGVTDIDKISRKELARRISFLPQQRPVPDITVEELIRLGRYPYLRVSGAVSKDDRSVIERAMKLTETLEMRYRNLKTLSGGERQRAYIAMLLAQDTDIVLLDEPTTYLDPKSKYEVMQLLRSVKDEGKTVIAVLHDLPLALSCCDEAVLIRNGRCAAVGKPDELCESGSFKEVFGIEVRHISDGGADFFAELPML